jgi:hypothetical protein
MPERPSDYGESLPVELTRSELFFLADELNQRIAEIDQRRETDAERLSSHWHAELLSKLLDAHARLTLQPWRADRPDLDRRNGGTPDRRAGQDRRG